MSNHIYPNEPPPPYSLTPQNFSPHYQPQAQPSIPGVSYPVANQQYIPQQHMIPGQTVMIPDAFDAGARFTGAVHIPPPPPGHLPNAAQLAVMQGQKVIIGQKKASKFSGGSGAGYTFW